MPRSKQSKIAEDEHVEYADGQDSQDGMSVPDEGIVESDVSEPQRSPIADTQYQPHDPRTHQRKAPVMPKRMVSQESEQETAQLNEPTAEEDNDDMTMSSDAAFVDDTTIEILRQQIDDLNKQIRSQKRKIAEYEREKMSEQERREADYRAAQQRAVELEQKLRRTTAERELMRIATEFQVDPQLAIELLATQVTFDEDGNPVNVRELIQTYVKRYPQLVQRQTLAGTPNPSSNKRDQPRALTRDDIARMTEEEINRRWNDPDFQKAYATAMAV